MNIEFLAPDVLKIIAPAKLSADDFTHLAPEVDGVIKRFGTIRLLIDATHLTGWENIGAFETHAGFIKNHQSKVQRLAVIAPHEWQHWLVGAIRIFLHPQARAFRPDQEDEARRWLTA
jgi:hypothetical protein